MSHKHLLYTNAHSEVAKKEIRSRSGLGQGAVKVLLLLLLASCSHVFYQPIKGALVNSERFGAKPEEVWLKAKDGTKIFAWAFRAENPKGTILHFHGNAENMSTHFLNLWWLVKEGYDLLVFDYRGYGFSEGEPTQAGVNLDALAAMEWGYQDHLTRKTKLYVVYGQSLGGQIAARALVDFPQQENVSLLVQDSTFPSYQGIAAKKLGARWFLWPLYPLAYLAVSDEYASENVLAQIKVPVLGIHSPKDDVVEYELGRNGFDKITSRKTWWKIKEGAHTDVFHLPKTTYRQQFLDFLSRL
jgi:fermentation-respiration switch protein FrsA (DUF1100 family)